MKKVLLKLKMPAMLLCSGIFSALPLLFPQLGFFQWLSLIPMAMVLIWLVQDEKTKLLKAYGFGIIFYMGFYPVIYHSFLYMYPLDFTGITDNTISIVIVVLACFGIAFFQAIFSALGFVVFVAAARTKLVRRVPYLMPILMAGIWVVAEWWQTVGWWGLPWGKLALGQVTFTLLVRSASLFGPYFISFIIVAFNFFLAMVILKVGVRRIVIAAPIAIFAFNLALGLIVTVSYKESDRTVKMAAAQGNLSSRDKENQGIGYQGILDVYCDLTEKAAAEGAKMIVWPETALPYDLSVHEHIGNKVREIAIENDITILISALTTDEESGMKYNSLYEINSKGEFSKDVYNKINLVPFGEFVPMREFFTMIFPPLEDIKLLDNDLKPGEESIVINGEYGRVGCGICFDGVYESVVFGAVNNGAEVIVMATNYSWFKDSRALNMHTAHMQLRAIESGRYVVCSGNTGISTIVDPRGNVLEEIGILERGYIVSDVQMRNERTLYSLIGNSFVALCAIGAVAVLSVEIVLQIKGRREGAEE